MGETTHSVWEDVSVAPESTPLERDATTEVCVVGAGIAGLATAYQLVRDGRRVTVVDAGSIAGGETARTTAHLASAVDDRYFEIERVHGADAARVVHDSHDSAIQWFHETARDEDIACDLASVDGYLFLPPGGDRSILERELEAARRAGCNDARALPRAPLESFDTGPCILFPRQAQIHPTAFLRGLAGAIERRGGVLHSHTHVDGLERDAGSLVVRCANGRTVRADAVVFATNTPVNDRVAIHTKQHAYLTYALALPIASGAVPRALYWDTSQSADETDGPYHYVRLAGTRGDVLVVGGEDHKVGQADDGQERWARLEAWARERFPVTGARISHWSGEVMEPVDGVAFIGADPTGPEGVYVITGDSGMGMTHGAIAGMVISDLVAGRHNEWAELYDPARRKLRAAGTYAKENLNTAAQYGDWLQRGLSAADGEQANGTGVIVRRGLHLVARYRDDVGVLHECSAVCPHLGGIVRWNSGEKSWDCPAHGSRFDPKGAVFHGPSLGPLEAVSAPRRPRRS
jgi:glycine/D-amino acid oxidase-like deaminating enzyme/nitrite reductase/ring-hydroxylating ferredoxin subunit